MTWPRWLRRAVRNRHRHAIEQAPRRWRGDRRGDSGRTRRKFDFHTGLNAARTRRSWPSPKPWKAGMDRKNVVVDASTASVLRITRSRGGGAGVLGCHIAARTVCSCVRRAVSRSRGCGVLELRIRPQAATFAARTVRATGAAVRAISLHAKSRRSVSLASLCRSSSAARLTRLAFASVLRALARFSATRSPP